MRLRLHVVSIVEPDGDDYSLESEKNLRIKSNVTSTARVGSRVRFLKDVWAVAVDTWGCVAHRRPHTPHTKINNTVNKS